MTHHNTADDEYAKHRHKGDESDPIAHLTKRHRISREEAAELVAIHGQSLPKLDAAAAQLKRPH